jgi:hypothetical protein
LCRAELPAGEDDACEEDGVVGREKRRHEAAGTSVAGAAVRREASYGLLAAAGGVLSG